MLHARIENAAITCKHRMKENYTMISIQNLACNISVIIIIFKTISSQEAH